MDDPRLEQTHHFGSAEISGREYNVWDKANHNGFKNVLRCSPSPDWSSTAAFTSGRESIIHGTSATLFMVSVGGLGFSGQKDRSEAFEVR
ncbi:unnamed protein product [Discula destructiva]